MEVTLRYVRHEEVEHYLRAGWVVTHDLADCYHGQFSVLMVGPLTAASAPRACAISR
jgi:hypothetical protein